MPERRRHRHTNRKQRRTFLDRIDKIAAAIYWIVKTIILITKWWFTR